jgi:plastocyanin
MMVARTTRRAAVALLVLGVPLMMSACSKTEPTAAPTTGAPRSGTTMADAGAGVTVTIKDFAFGPKKVTIKAGQKVTFKNDDTAPHEPSEGTPGKKGPTFDVPTASGESDSTPALQPGTYSYYCALHEYMKGEIIVE